MHTGTGSGVHPGMGVGLSGAPKLVKGVAEDGRADDNDAVSAGSRPAHTRSLSENPQEEMRGKLER